MLRRTLLAALRARLAHGGPGRGGSPELLRAPPRPTPAERDRDAPSVLVALPRTARAAPRPTSRPSLLGASCYALRLRKGALRKLVFSNAASVAAPADTLRRHDRKAAKRGRAYPPAVTCLSSGYAERGARSIVSAHAPGAGRAASRGGLAARPEQALVTVVRQALSKGEERGREEEGTPDKEGVGRSRNGSPLRT